MSYAAAAGSPAAERDRGLVALHLLKERRVSEASLAAAGFADLEELLAAVGRRFKLPRIELDTLELNHDLSTIVPRAVAEKHRVVPTFVSPEELSLATCDPTHLEVFDWIAAQAKRSVTIMLASPGEIDRALRRLYQARHGAGARVDEPSEAALLEAVGIVDRWISGAVAERASDIHIEAAERETVLRYRVDGALRPIETRPAELHPAIVSRIKILAELDIAVRQVPQDGRIKLTLGGATIDLRVSVLPTFWGEKICMRILDNQKALLPLDELGFDPDQLTAFRTLINAPYGLLLVTGPTGSGKSTTLYAALNAVRSPETNIVSVEDPVEYQLPGINQVQVNAKRGLTFAGALRSILRQDPDVILVGEVRDHETGVIAAEAALTGHLVMASLHTNDAPSAVTRLTEMGIEPYLVAPSLVGVVAQRLLRRVCAACAEEYTPTAKEVAVLRLAALPPGVTFRRAVGCARCHGTGYAGRLAVRELLEVDDALRALIAEGANAADIGRQARQSGFQPMRYQALKRLFAGATTVREVLRLTRG